MENWRPVQENPAYEVSDLGRVRRAEAVASEKRGGRLYGDVGRIRRPQTRPDGYRIVVLGNLPARYIHRLVMESFVGPCPAGQQVAHLDGDRANNALGNLIYATPLENSQHKYAHQTMVRGERVWRARLTPEAVTEIKRSSEHPRTIATQYGVNVCTVRDILAGRTWRHVQA